MIILNKILLFSTTCLSLLNLYFFMKNDKKIKFKFLNNIDFKFFIKNRVLFLALLTSAYLYTDYSAKVDILNIPWPQAKLYRSAVFQTGLPNYIYALVTVIFALANILLINIYFKLREIMKVQ